MPNAEETPRQLANGTELLEPRGRRGAGVIRIANQSGQEAVAKLSSQSAPEIPLRLVYLQSGHEFTLNNIGPGLYFVSFSLGPVTSKPRMFGRRFGPFQFMQIESTSGAQSDQYQVVLKPVR
jgi:hypothetical protein